MMGGFTEDSIGRFTDFTIGRTPNVAVLFVDMLLYFNNQQMSHLVRKPTMWFPNRTDTNQAVQYRSRLEA